MDTVTILRDLWRYRVLLAEVCVVALLVGFAVLFKVSFPPKLESRKYEVGVATTRILVDTPSSQVVEIAPKGTESLGVRANLLASLMVDGGVKRAIAERAGLRPSELVGISTSATDTPVERPRDPRASVLETRVVTDNDGSQLPIIEVKAQAADVAAAARLASASVSGLRDYLDSKAAAQRVADAERLQVSGLGVPQAEMATRGPKNIFAVLAVLFVFGAGCAGILALVALVRAWRASFAQETGAGFDQSAETAQDPGLAAADGVEQSAAHGGDDWGEDRIPSHPTPRSSPRGRRPARAHSPADEPQARSA
jgi:hypothetical protein